MKEFVLSNRSEETSRSLCYADELNEEQLAVVEAGDGACLVLAGAGSGKTRTITYRVAYLLEGGVRPEEILLLTFTNKAAKEMLSRVEMLLGRYPTGLWGGTFHSIANRLLRQYAAQIGFTPNFTIMDADDVKSLIKVCIKELRIETKARRFPSPAKLSAIISYARNSATSIGQVIESRFESFTDLAATVESIAAMYTDRKRSADAMDFDDLLIHLRDLLVNQPVVRERLATQFRYVLVDEYQDTNALQSQIIDALAHVHKNILVVGDDAQSIYSFRAADVYNILSFPERYGETKTFKLTTNYRSTPEILTVANEVIAHNRKQFKKTLTAVCGSLERPCVVPAAHAGQEAQYIAEQILSLQEDGTELSEIAVLFRAAFHSQQLELELSKRDIPYEYRGGMKFFERAHVKDVVAHLRVFANPRDEVAWMRVLGLQVGIGLVTAGKIIKQLAAHGDIETIVGANLQVGARAQTGWRFARQTLESMAASDRTPAALIRCVCSGSYRDYLEAEYPDVRDRLDDLEQFALFAEGYTSLTTFLDEVTLTDSYGAERAGEFSGHEEGRLVLSTIHQAKGLEWNTVFVMHLTQGKFPNERALEEDSGAEEERRLFYVAVTRARKQLFLTYPLSTGFDHFALTQPSMFLSEISPESTESVRLKNMVPSGVFGARGRQEEPAIVLDDYGEVMQTPQSYRSLLRNIDEL